MSGSPVDPFYAVYSRYKGYETPVLCTKHMSRWDRDVWVPAELRPDMSVLEFGCGTGSFLAYLHAKGVKKIVGVDHDPNLTEIMPKQVRNCLVIGNLWDYIAENTDNMKFDRIALFDVLEHFSYEDGLKLLKALRKMLTTDGQVILRVPNVSSPWGIAYQFGDLTHRAAYTPKSLRQMALAAGLAVSACYPHREGSRVRQVLDRSFHGLLSKIVATPPSIWTANMYAILSQER
jgi:2-polyprenyl-3-methyl-5-hydroxy-6-metoxy-1,4-benzoquinol methylase